MYAALRGRTDCARLLIDAGADNDITENVRVGRCVAETPPRFVFPISALLYCSQHHILSLINLNDFSGYHGQFMR